MPVANRHSDRRGKTFRMRSTVTQNARGGSVCGRLLCRELKTSVHSSELVHSNICSCIAGSTFERALRLAERHPKFRDVLRSSDIRGGADDDVARLDAYFESVDGAAESPLV